MQGIFFIRTSELGGETVFSYKNAPAWRHHPPAEKTENGGQIPYNPRRLD
ncbi:hypothetical protein HMPREF9080_01880 [Cardiobacterium valvarum F0432]|uniref:Uncharacterized protein n=1 Tax=Cardiobacterium valvarum F0432 TaxID=797473 RepID=G9ZGH7_9GAMM|nr:hypothetical protein HMPREF9080_01880 [Cardiobacterium valvarum F0432]